MELLVSISFFLILALGWQVNERAEASIEISTSGDCNNDFQNSIKNKAHNLRNSQLQQLDLLMGREDPIEGWRFLAGLGDSYAALAAKVLDPRGGFQDQYYRNLILRHWKNSVGPAERQRAFYSTARQHFRQYAGIVQKGLWPDSDQILLSYLTAARSHQLPDLVVFDAAWDAAGMNNLRRWQSLNHLNGDRLVYPTRACFEISSSKAKEVILKDLLGGPFFF